MHVCCPVPCPCYMACLPCIVSAACVLSVSCDMYTPFISASTLVVSFACRVTAVRKITVLTARSSTGQSVPMLGQHHGRVCRMPALMPPRMRMRPHYPTRALPPCPPPAACAAGCPSPQPSQPPRRPCCPPCRPHGPEPASGRGRVDFPFEAGGQGGEAVLASTGLQRRAHSNHPALPGQRKQPESKSGINCSSMCCCYRPPQTQPTASACSHSPAPWPRESAQQNNWHLKHSLLPDVAIRPTCLLHGVAGQHAKDDRHARISGGVQHAAGGAAHNRVVVRGRAAHLE